MPQSLSRILLHLIFSTKNRTPYFIDPVIRKDLADDEEDWGLAYHPQIRFILGRWRVSPMSSILELIHDNEIRRFETGQVVIEQGKRTDLLFFLIEGTVEVVKDGVPVVTASQPGAVFGELSALLGGNHTATVRALKPSSFHVVQNPREFLEASPIVCLHVCELVARRLDALNKYLVNVKQQFEGDEHLGMVDNLLETLMHRHPISRVRPSESKIRQTEPTD